MTEIITIDTENNILKEKNVEILSVLTENSPLLSIKVQEYEESLPNSAVSYIIERLKATMKHYQGVGLSANQCGINLRAFVMGVNDFIITCINPKIISKSDNFVAEKEGCLSYPALFLNKKRSDKIEVEYLNELGELKRVEFSGLTARIFQHELDHLNGVQFTDNVGKTTMILAREKQKKLIRKFSRIVRKNNAR